jgi:hypothetical protein
MNKSNIKFYFHDVLRQCQGLQLVSGPVKKHTGILVSDSPGELTYASSFAGTVIDNGQGGYYLYYYTTRIPDFAFEIHLAVSSDGLHWEKPSLGQVRTAEGQETNIFRIEGLPEGTHPVQPIVHHLEDGSWRMYFWLHGNCMGGYMCRYVVAVSCDGLMWTCADINQACVYHPQDVSMPAFDWTQGLVMNAPKKKTAQVNPIEALTALRKRSNDATFVVRNPQTGEWEMYSVWLTYVPPTHPRYCAHDNAPGAIRTIHRRTSQDGLEWSDPQLIISQDENDPIDQQFYHLAVLFEGTTRIGLLGHYRLDEQTQDMEICFSRDGMHWNRPLRGGWLPRGETGAFDSASIYPTQGFIRRGEHLLLPYWASDMRHNYFVTKEYEQRLPQAGVCMAEIHQDRLVGLQSQKAIRGFMQTRPFIMQSTSLNLDANISGQIRYSLCDIYGVPLPGYTANDCLPLHGDSHEHTLRWNGDKSVRENQYNTVSLRLELENATLYGIHY